MNLQRRCWSHSSRRHPPYRCISHRSLHLTCTGNYWCVSHRRRRRTLSRSRFHRNSPSSHLRRGHHRRRHPGLCSQGTSLPGSQHDKNAEREQCRQAEREKGAGLGKKKGQGGRLTIAHNAGVGRGILQCGKPCEVKVT